MAKMDRAEAKRALDANNKERVQLDKQIAALRKHMAELNDEHRELERAHADVVALEAAQEVKQRQDAAAGGATLRTTTR